MGLAIPQRAGFYIFALMDALMDKDHKEILQVTKELTGKFIETRTVSPGNFAEIFPAVYRVVRAAVLENDGEQARVPADGASDAAVERRTYKDGSARKKA
ncbi:MAG: hypothetical protein LBB60_04375 [Desulfovibrio sp.]|nr:hypothetical protein [Desulfovibrio sp.]